MSDGALSSCVTGHVRPQVVQHHMRVTTEPVTVVSVLILAVAPQNWQRSGIRSRKRFGTARAYC